MAPSQFYPTSPKDELSALYIGKSIRDVPTPAAVINVAAARRNCERMLQTCVSLGLGWRAHVKTHKTAELTRLQVGDDNTRPANIVVSTLAEAEFLLDLLLEYKNSGRKVNLLYGLPISRGALGRLAAIGAALGEGSISVLIDDPAQIPILAQFQDVSGIVPLAHIKIDMGGRRAGVIEDSARFLDVANAALDAHKQGKIILAGLYSHAGHSYGGDSRTAAVKMMRAELEAMLSGADRIQTRVKEIGISDAPKLVVSAGASPTALSVQNLLTEQDATGDNGPPELKQEASSLSQLFTTIANRGHSVEIHAGVYPTLDLQQLAAHSMAASRLSWNDIAITVLAEVHSNYPGRGEGGTPEALIGSGGLALGREFCKAYEGMAMVTPWGRAGVETPKCDVEDYEGWMVGRFAQEHGILTWRRGKDQTSESHIDVLDVGQMVRLWPNHACITSSHFGWYFVVDEDAKGKENEIVDIWIKARGW